MDCEDSIVSVDTDDKIATFRNWMGLLDKTIKTEVKKDNVSFVRELSKDIFYKNPNGKASTPTKTHNFNFLLLSHTFSNSPHHSSILAHGCSTRIF